MKFMNKVVFFITSVLTLLFNVTAQDKEIVLDEVIAIIGDEIATKSELESRYSEMIANGLKVTDNSRCEVLEDILYSKMLLNQAKIDSVEVTDAQVEGELDRRIRYYVAQIGSEKALEDYYKKPIPKIKDEFRESLRESLLIQAMQGQVTSGITVTPEEVRTYFKEIPEDSLPLMNAEVEVAQIVINAKTSRKAITEVKEKLREYKRRVAEGEKFSTLAVLYSEDKGSALKGGEIGFVGKAEVEPEFGVAAFKLKPGNVSPIVETRYGYHIIQMIERRGSKANVRHILLKPKQDAESFEKAENKLDSIATLIENEKYTFEEAARIFSEDEETQKGGGIIVNPATTSSMTPMDELDPSLFFVIDKMKIGEVSKPVQISDPRMKPGFRLIKLNKRTEPHRASLEKDYQKIKNAALAEKEQTVLQDWMKKAVTRTYIKLDNNYVEGCKFMQPWLENMAQ